MQAGTEHPGQFGRVRLAVGVTVQGLTSYEFGVASSESRSITGLAGRDGLPSANEFKKLNRAVA